MAKRPNTPDSLREAVERTVQATIGSAERGRDRTQGALDELVDTLDQLVRGAEAGFARSRKAVSGALEERRPATLEDVRELKAELRRIGRRLDAIEERLPARRGGAKKPAATRAASAERSKAAAPKREGKAAAPKRRSSG